MDCLPIQPKQAPITKKHGRVDIERAITLYTVQHLTVRQIGAIMGVSGAGVNKALRKAGITSEQGEWLTVKCDQCAEEYPITRAKWRNTIKHYCTWECRAKSLENPAYVVCRTGCKTARKLVAQVFDLQPYHIVHHHDSDQSHNELSNLAVFASASDHHSFERGGYARPIWDGAEYVKSLQFTENERNTTR